MEGPLRPATLGGMVAESPEQLHHLLAAAFNAGDPTPPSSSTSATPSWSSRRTVGWRAAPPRSATAVAETIAMRPTAELRVVGKVQQDGIALTHGRWSMQGTDAAGERVTHVGSRHDGLPAPGATALADRARQRDGAGVITWSRAASRRA